MRASHRTRFYSNARLLLVREIPSISFLCDTNYDNNNKRTPTLPTTTTPTTTTSQPHHTHHEQHATAATPTALNKAAGETAKSLNIEIRSMQLFKRQVET